MMVAVEDCSPGDVRHLLAHDSFLTMLKPDLPNEQSLMDLLVDNNVIVSRITGSIQ